MAKTENKKSKETITEDVFVEIRKTRNVRHNAPITFEGYTDTDGTARQMRFKEDEEGFKRFGGRVTPLRVGDDGVVLNLKNPLDNLRYTVAKEMRDKGIFPFEPQEPLVMIIEPEAEDNSAVDAFDRELKAMKVISEDLADPKDLREFAHYFGLADGKDVTVKRNMIDLAKTSPEQFLEGWTDEFRHIMVLVRKSIDKGIIGLKADTGIYVFGEKVLGMNHNEIVTTLAKDTALVAVLNNKVS